MASDTTRYTNKVFMTGALPLLKTIANDVPELKNVHTITLSYTFFPIDAKPLAAAAPIV